MTGLMPEVSLRKPETVDLPFLVHLMKDPDVAAGIPGSAYLQNSGDFQEFIRAIRQKEESGSELHFSVCLPDGEPVGMCALHDLDVRAGRARIGYWIGKRWWGRGYGKSAVSALVEMAFQNLGIKELVAESSGSNVRSARLLASLGFREAEADGAAARGMRVFHLVANKGKGDNTVYKP